MPFLTHHSTPLLPFPFNFLEQEYEIDKTLGITGPDDVAKMGIDKYNDECRKIVMRYSGDWEVSDLMTVLLYHVSLDL